MKMSDIKAKKGRTERLNCGSSLSPLVSGRIAGKCFRTRDTEERRGNGKVSSADRREQQHLGTGDQVSLEC